MEVRDDTVWDGATPIATFTPSAYGGGAVSLQLVAPMVLSRAVATALVAAVAGTPVPARDPLREEGVRVRTSRFLVYQPGTDRSMQRSPGVAKPKRA